MCLRFIVCHFPHFRYEFLWQRHVALFSIVLFTSYCCAGGQRTENCPFIYFRMIFRLKMFEHFIIQITFFSKISSRITIFAFRITKYFHHLFFNLIFLDTFHGKLLLCDWWKTTWNENVRKTLIFILKTKRT